MLSALRSEVRKLLTVRSTYILCSIALLISGFVGFWVMGYKGDGESSHLIMDAVGISVWLVSTFAAIVAILLLTHEYRYNTIMYSLTASNSRSKVLAAKVAVITAFALVFMALAALFVALLTWIGMQIQGDVVAQEFLFKDMLWRMAVYLVGYVLMGLLFAVLFRHVVGAIATFLILPGTIESLLGGLLLKENAKYLPFSALESVVTEGPLRPLTAVGVFAIYLVVGWVIAWTMFLRRDAN